MKYIILLLSLLAAPLLQAQNFNVAGKVSDERGEGLPGATVLLQYPWEEMVKGTVTDIDGNFKFADVAKGGYRLKISMLGFEEVTGEVTITDADVNTGAIRLTGDSKVLSEVQIEAQTVTSVQRGDTSEFNAGAFKVLKDASAEELIEKIPGVTMENGQMKAQGENIQQVLVDGKPFFGNDPSAAMKNIPAELIEKVQIYDAQSDQAQFTGFNDGNTTKTINIVTRSGMQNGQFGKIYAGYGYDNKYQAGGNVNFFDGDRRISLIGMSNNINQQNFSAEDILGVMGGGGSRSRGGGRGGRGGQGGMGDFLVNSSGGISTTTAFGLNYSDKWGKKVEVSGSYFFNNSINNTERFVNRQFLNNENVADEVYDESSLSHTDNLNHRFNLRLTYNIDSSNTLIFRPRLTVQQNSGNSSTMGATNLNAALLNSTANNYGSNLDGINMTNSLLWRHKFDKKGRTVSLDLTNGFAPKKGESTLLSVNGFYPTGESIVDSLNQQSRLDVNSWNMSGNLEYTEPISEHSQVLFNYKASYQQEASDRSVYDWNTALMGYDLLNEPLSNVFSNDYITHQGGLGYTYAIDRVFNLTARVNTQWASLMNDQTFPQQTQVNNLFTNVLPSLSIRYSIDKNKNLRFNYRSNTQLPSVEQLQNVVNNTNPLQLTAGNPALKQAEQHNIFMRYQVSNPANSRTLFFLAGGGFTRDYIGKSTFLASSDNPIFADLNVQPGAQLTLPTNLDGYYTGRSFFTYGLPIKAIKSNLNFDASYNFTRTPGLVNEQLNNASTHAFGAGFTLGSNISDKVDFTVSTRPTWNTSYNSLQTAANTKYLSQNSRVKLNWIIAEGFVLRTDLAHTLYSGLSDGFNQSYYLWNIGIGKKVFKNQRGEITLAVNDILNQNRDIQRTITESYVEDTRSNALTRFVMLSFTYNIRNFNSGKTATERPSEGWDMRPPPGRG